MTFHGSKIFRLGIVGRPNVGKSTFFNRFLGQKRALVYDAPGMTRDWQCYDVALEGKPWKVYDTPGLETRKDSQEVFSSIKNFLKFQQESTTPLFDVLLWLVDGKKDPQGQDYDLVEFFRKQSQELYGSLLLGINKCENRNIQHKAMGDWTSMGIPFVLFSALHGDNMSELYDHLGTQRAIIEEKILKPTTSGSTKTQETPDIPKNLQENSLPCHDRGNNNAHKEFAAQGERSPQDPSLPKTIALTIIGKPNVGKSSLTNVLLGYNRMKTGPQAGLTRDAVTTALEWTAEDGQLYTIRLTDTAGVSKGIKMKNPSKEFHSDQEAMANLAWKDMQRALCFSHVTLVVVDATEPIGHQDLSLLKMALEEKRCVVVVLNKWDMVGDPQKVFYDLPRLLDQSHLVPFSAKTRYGQEELRRCILTRFDQWSQHVPTAPLNRWLGDVLSEHTPPLVKGRRIKIRYVTQCKTKPPTFDFFGSQVSLLPKSYERYLQKKLTEDFNLANPILRFKSPKNPFVKR